MSSSASSLTKQITTLLSSYVEEKEAELRAIKGDRDKEPEKNEQLTLEIKAFQKKIDDLSQEHTLGLATIEDHLEKLGRAFEVLKLRDRIEMEGKIKRFMENIKREKGKMEEHSLEMATLKGHLEKLEKENEVLKKEKEELEEDLKKQKRKMEMIIDGS